MTMRDSAGNPRGFLCDDSGNLKVAGTFEAPAGGATAAKQDTQITAEQASATSLAIIDDWDESDRAKVNIIVGQAGITAGAGAVAANTPRVTHASDDPVVARLPTALAANGGLKVEGVAGGVAQPVSGPQTNAEFLAALRSTAAFTSVASGTSSVTILASNANRKGAIIVNTDANILYLDLTGGTAAATRYAADLATGEGYEVPFGITGTITGVWAGDGAGSALVTEAS
jgi:hypothetical protein